MAALESINAIADAAPGFVWRLQTNDGDATSVPVFGSTEAKRSARTTIGCARPD